VTETGDPGVGATAGGWLELTAFQMEVARLFFALPESAGFLLAGGAALVAQHLTTRPTEDLHHSGNGTRTGSPRRPGGCIPGAGLEHRADPRQQHILSAGHPGQ